MPTDVEWIKEKCVTFQPEENKIILANGHQIATWSQVSLVQLMGSATVGLLLLVQLVDRVEILRVFGRFFEAFG